MSVVVASKARSSVVITSQQPSGKVLGGRAIPPRDPLSTPIDVDGVEAETLGGAVEELAARFEEDTDGLVGGIDFLTYYKLARDN